MTTKRLRKALPIQRDFEKMTIKLEQVIEAIEMSDDFFTSFWDTKTGETVYSADPLLNGETDEVLAAEIENDPKRFLRFPTKYEIHEYRIMENFIEQLSPGKVQSDLSYSIRGKGAFRRFKESIRYHGLEQQWYDYLEKAYRDIAVRWCTEEGLAYSVAQRNHSGIVFAFYTLTFTTIFFTAHAPAAVWRRGAWASSGGTMAKSPAFRMMQPLSAGSS